jgi:hypothetical protein
MEDELPRLRQEGSVNSVSTTFGSSSGMHALEFRSESCGYHSPLYNTIHVQQRVQEIPIRIR